MSSKFHTKWKKEDEAFLAKNIVLGFKQLSKIMKMPYQKLYNKAKRMHLDLDLAKRADKNHQNSLNLRESHDTPQSVVDFRKEATELTMLLICTDWSLLKIGVRKK